MIAKVIEFWQAVFVGVYVIFCRAMALWLSWLISLLEDAQEFFDERSENE